MIAGRPSRVAGIWIMAFGRLTFSQSPDSLLPQRLQSVGQTRINLDGDAAIDEIGGFGDLTEDVGGGTSVVVVSVIAVSTSTLPVP